MGTGSLTVQIQLGRVLNLSADNLRFAWLFRDYRKAVQTFGPSVLYLIFKIRIKHQALVYRETFAGAWTSFFPVSCFTTPLLSPYKWSLILKPENRNPSFIGAKVPLAQIKMEFSNVTRLTLNCTPIACVCLGSLRRLRCDLHLWLKLRGRGIQLIAGVSNCGIGVELTKICINRVHFST